jgi:hypothetical protein
MVRSVLLLPALLTAAIAAGPGAEELPKGEKPKKEGWALQEGNNVPAPFHPYYVFGPHLARLEKEAKDARAKVTGGTAGKGGEPDADKGPRAKIAGRFHCPVSHHGLDPMLLLFVRETDVSDGLKDLLVRLDAVVKKNPNVRLGVAVVFISDKIEDVVTDDEIRDELADQLKKTASDLKWQDEERRIAFCLDGKRDLEKWELGRGDATYVLVLLRNYAVVAAEAIKRDDLNAAKGDAILRELAEKFGATRK